MFKFKLRAFCVVFALIFVGLPLIGCEGDFGIWAKDGGGGNNDISQTVKIGEEFTLRQNETVNLVDAKGSDLNLSVTLSGWSICPKNAMCQVQDRVIWSVNTNGRTIEPHATTNFHLIETPLFRIELISTDWKNQAAFKIEPYSQPELPKADKKVKLDAPFSLKAGESAALEEDPYLTVRLLSLSKCDLVPERRCETPSRVKFEAEYMDKKVPNGPNHLISYISKYVIDEYKSYAITVTDTDYETAATFVITR